MRCVQRRACPRPLHLNLFPTSTPPLINYPQRMHKDLHSLRTALESGPSSVFWLVTPIGCYPVDPDGDIVVFNHRNVRENEKEVKANYPIQWPTRSDYRTNAMHGTAEVDRAMCDFVSDHGLKASRIKGWTKVEVPSPRQDVYAFLDCALYKVRLS